MTNVWYEFYENARRWGFNEHRELAVLRDRMRAVKEETERLQAQILRQPPTLVQLERIPL